MTDIGVESRVPLGHRVPPPWYGWTVKLGLAFTALLLAISLTLLIAWLPPAVRNLSQAVAAKTKGDACYDRYTSNVTDGNAASLNALAAQQGAIARLVVLLADEDRDEGAIDASIVGISQAIQRGAAALEVYERATDARTRWVANGRPLPCPLT